MYFQKIMFTQQYENGEFYADSQKNNSHLQIASDGKCKKAS